MAANNNSSSQQSTQRSGLPSSSFRDKMGPLVNPLSSDPDKKGKMRKRDNNEDLPVVSGKKHRRKWSPKETQMLVQGCQKHGIGNWKTILLDPELKFHARSPVDLNDRFRTYFLDAYKRHCLNAHTRLGRRRRRKQRHPFTEAEDRALKVGYEKHETNWAAIVKDPIFQDQARRSTDLRDRFRNAFPDLYEAVGYTPRWAAKLDGPDGTADGIDVLSAYSPTTAWSTNVEPASSDFLMKAAGHHHQVHEHGSSLSTSSSTSAVSSVKELFLVDELPSNWDQSNWHPDARNNKNSSNADIGADMHALSIHFSFMSDLFVPDSPWSPSSMKRKKSTSSSSSYGSAASTRSRSSWSTDIGEFPYAYPSTIPQRRSFYDSDDYLGRKKPLPTTNPIVPTKSGDPPFTVDSPQLPLHPITPPPSSQPSSPLPTKPRGISRLFRLPRNLWPPGD